MTYHKSRNEADGIWLQAFTIFHSSARNRILPASRRRNIMKNKLIALLTMSALAVGTLAGCGNTAATDTAASAADTAAEPPVEAVSTAADEAADTSADKYADLSGSVSMSGSTSMEKLANAVAESFMEKYPNVTVTAEFTGSSAGIESVLAGSVDIGNSSRNLKDDEKSAGAAENIVAIDGIAVVADPANKVEDLTKDQLVSIYTGETKNWSEVGGDDQAIVVVGREAGSGTRGAFEELLDIADALRLRKRTGFHRCRYGKGCFHPRCDRLCFSRCCR